MDSRQTSGPTIVVVRDAGTGEIIAQAVLEAALVLDDGRYYLAGDDVDAHRLSSAIVAGAIGWNDASPDILFRHRTCHASLTPWQV